MERFRNGTGFQGSDRAEMDTLTPGMLDLDAALALMTQSVWCHSFLSNGGNANAKGHHNPSPESARCRRLFARSPRADFIPPNLSPGSQYQLIFVTADTTIPGSSNINSYNSFVQSEAALNPSLPSATWTVVGSTASVDALTNSPNIMVGGSYLPVYNTQGVLVSDEATGGLYAGFYPSPVEVGYTQFGVYDPTDVWTGTESNGTSAPYFSPG